MLLLLVVVVVVLVDLALLVVGYGFDLLTLIVKMVLINQLYLFAD